MLGKVRTFYDHLEKTGTEPPGSYLYPSIKNDLTELGWTVAWDKNLVSDVYLPPWHQLKVVKDNSHNHYNCAVVLETKQMKNVDYFLDTKDLTLYLWKHGFTRVEAVEDEEGRAARHRSSLLKPDVALSKPNVVATTANAVSSQNAPTRSRKISSSAAAAAGEINRSPAESYPMSTSPDSASEVSVEGEDLVMSYVNEYYDALDAGETPRYYLYPAIKYDLAKLGWITVWDRNQGNTVFLAPWSGVEVVEKPSGNTCDVVQSGRKNNVDYFFDTKDLTLYLRKHGFNRVEAVEDEEGRAARRHSSLLKPDVAADTMNVVVSQKPPPRSRPLGRPVAAVNMSVSSPESDTSLDGEKVDQPLTPTAKVMQLIHEYDEYERENKRVPGKLLPSLPPSTGTIKPSNNYHSMCILQVTASCRGFYLIC